MVLRQAQKIDKLCSCTMFTWGADKNLTEQQMLSSGLPVFIVIADQMHVNN